MRWFRLLLVGLVSASVLHPGEAFAVRPFITDDARVVGNRLWQVETWPYVDRDGIQHWALFAYGPTPWLELTIGGVQGRSFTADASAWSMAGPLFQAKALIRDVSNDGIPGIALAAGTITPFGFGTYKGDRLHGFTFVALTSSLFSNTQALLVHVNAGVATASDEEKANPRAGESGPVIPRFTWGVGTQIRVHKGFHFVGESFSGDPHSPGSGVAAQIGFRHFFEEDVQVDATLGSGLTGEDRLPPWFSIGLRWVFAGM